MSEYRPYCLFPGGYSTCGAYCGPCRAPSCEGNPDGVNMYDGRPWTSWYTICYKERLVTELTCPVDNRVQLPQIYSPELHGCVTIDRIPPEHGGQMPNCTGKEDGRYPNEYGKCDFYTECKWGHFIRSVKCDMGKAFDEVLRECTKSPKNTCTCDPSSC